MKRTIAFGVTILLTVASAASARERTVIEERLAEENFCAGLQTEQLGQTIGITELEDVELREADFSLRGDEVSVSFFGRLACRAPEDSLLTGNASAAVAASAELSLSDCAVRDLSIGLSEFEGTFGPLLGTFSGQIEQALAGEAEPLLVAACHDLRGAR